MKRAAEAGQWGVVATLAAELAARRDSKPRNPPATVVKLEAVRRRGGRS